MSEIRAVPGAMFLGRSAPLAAAAANTPVVTFGPGYSKLFVYHFIAGYAGGGGIARLRFGAASGVVSATQYSAITEHTVPAASGVSVTSRVNEAGVRVANDTTTNARRGLHEIYNPSGAGIPLMCDGRTITYNAAGLQTPTTVQATFSKVVGHWFSGTQAVCVDMDGGGVNLNASSFIEVHGIPG